MSKPIDYSKFDNIDTDTEEEEEAEEEGEEEEEVEEEEEEEYEAGGAFLEGFPNPFAHPPQTKDTWFKVGHVLIHPSEEENYSNLYSETVLMENPETYVPDPSNFEDGIVTDWGIGVAPIDETKGMEAFMQRLHQKMNQRFSVYGEDDSPTKQFIKILEDRKLAHAESPDIFCNKDLIFLLKVSLCENERDVWRIVRVPSGIELSKLHDQVLVPVMGWSRGYHCYVFEDPKDGAVLGPKKYAGHIDAMHFPMHYSHVMDDRRIPLVALIKEVGDYIQYTYDLGDQWRHKIELIDVIDPTSEKADTTTSSASVQLLDGAGACPPEDGNGLEDSGCFGYADFLKRYKKNPKNSKIKRAISGVESSAVNYSQPWLGGPPLRYHPLKFDIDRHRILLATMLAGPALHTRGQVFREDGEEQYKHCYKACTGCGDRMKALMRCGQCGAWYCSRQCQVDDWKNHKKACKEAQSKKKKKNEKGSSGK